METEDMMNALFCEFPSFRCSDALKTRDEMFFTVVLRVSIPPLFSHDENTVLIYII